MMKGNNRCCFGGYGNEIAYNVGLFTYVKCRYGNLYMQLFFIGVHEKRYFEKYLFVCMHNHSSDTLP